MSSTLRRALCAAASLFFATSSFAHVSFDTGKAAPNSTVKAVLRVPHGCDGQPTLKVRVTIPDGVIAVKPMPKAGWTLDTALAAYSAPYQLYGEPVTEGVREIVWSGSLPDAHYDEFVFQARVTDKVPAGANLAFPVVQECASAKEEWTEIAAPGQDPHSLTMPAPTLVISEAPASTPVTFKAGAITVEQPWARATPGGAKVAGGYLRVTNTGSTPDRLLGGTFERAGKVEVHQMSMTNDVMRMAPVEGGLEIGPGETVELKPGGFHLMFLDMAGALKAGETIRGTLDFEKAGAVTLKYSVRGMSGDASSEHKH
jgi:uncharacterized protein YcnI